LFNYVVSIFVKTFCLFYYTFCFLYPDEITSIDHIGIKSNELFQLKQGLLADFSDAKLNEVFKSNNLDVSDEIICLSLSKFPFLLSHTSSIYYQCLNNALSFSLCV